MSFIFFTSPATLATIFVVLKLVGTIQWIWFWVLSPLWISWLLIGVLWLINTALE